MWGELVINGADWARPLRLLGAVVLLVVLLRLRPWVWLSRLVRGHRG